MTTDWQLTVDCARPTSLAAFWAAALGYVTAPPPPGFATWEGWLRAQDVPEDEWDSGASISDPKGVLPALSFLQVPEDKLGKNRLHVDLQVGGGRQLPWEERWPRVLVEVQRLVGLGGVILSEVPGGDGRGDHVVLADPEGNEFCVL